MSTDTPIVLAETDESTVYTLTLTATRRYVGPEREYTKTGTHADGSDRYEHVVVTRRRTEVLDLVKMTVAGPPDVPALTRLVNKWGAK